MIRTLVADDAALARERIARMLSVHSDVTIVSQVADGVEALTACRRLAPDLVILDIAMPGMNGLALARALAGSQAPVILFLTAHRSHALPAFELEAVDYMLKPVTADRLAGAMRRVRTTLAGRASAALPRLVVTDGGRTSIIPQDRIDYIAAAGHYLLVHAEGRATLTREPIAAIEQRLAPGFLRIHRSTIVRLDRVASVIERRNTDADAVLVDGTVLRVSRTNRAALDRWLAGRTAHAT